MADTLGEAFVEVHARSDEMDEDVKNILDDILDDGDKQFEKAGKEIGEKIADSASDELGKHGKDFGASINKSLGKQKIRPDFDIEFEGGGRKAKQSAEGLVDSIVDAFDEANRPGGPFQKIGTGIADAIGAGFNVSGRSPLIALLIPLVGVIVGLVVAASQAVGALLALLGTLPALLTGIGLQVGVLLIAFEGMGEAISGAFAAKNTKELNEALKGLTEPAKDFVKSLLPVRDLFREIAKSVQANFFKRFGQPLADLAVILGGLLKPNFARLARALGDFFNALANFFISPSFLMFVRTVFPSTIKFLQQFGPKFITFLTGLIDIAVASMPFLDRFGRIIGGVLEHIGTWLSDTAEDPKFLAWLDDMADTLDTVVELFFTLMEFVKTFLDKLNQAGGRNVIQAFADAFDTLIFFLQTPAGQKAMQGLVDLAIISIKVFTGVLLIILIILGQIEVFGETVNNILDGI